MTLHKVPLIGLLLLLAIIVSPATADGPVCPPSTKLSRASFPEGFLFGTATAAYQKESGKYYRDFLSQGVRPSTIKRDEL
ncbi:hypothetical protein BRARA_E03100 [Brassica rapa]|uniref:Uncharacterized protein n=1 Tax=Brassica campestris TaxID=3711 RepID=A0A397ZIG5_BRACM|nr:hypothetical protein BRARA_E03100 [Brassica rapa]